MTALPASVSRVGTEGNRPRRWQRAAAFEHAQFRIAVRSANGQSAMAPAKDCPARPSAGRRSPGSARFPRRPAGAAASCHRPSAASRSPRRSNRRARPVPSPTAHPCGWLRSGAVAKAARRHAARPAHRHDRAALSPRSVCPATTARPASGSSRDNSPMPSAENSTSTRAASGQPPAGKLASSSA